MEPLQSIYELKVVRERSAIYLPAARYRSSGDVYQAFKERFDKADREEFLVVLLDAKNKLTAYNVVSVGSLTSSIVHPREVVKAVALANAAALILLHNHPSSGDPNPSQEDLQITRRIRQVMDVMGVRVLDHIIIGDNTYVSFVDDCYWDQTTPPA
jgi:DNA repair protein RadC